MVLMRLPSPQLYVLLLLWIGLFTNCQEAPEPENPNLVKLDNPISEDYLLTNLRKNSPRLILTTELEAQLKEKLQTDPIVQNYYAAMKLNVDRILAEELLTRNVIGRRLLATSREMLYRIGVLGMVYRMEKNPDILVRIDQEIKAVCAFEDWNPSHFLDVAEMSMAVAIGIDWVGEDLPESTVALAKKALIEKGIQPSFEGRKGWIKGNNNWNQVCHGGMLAASIMVAEEEPQLAVRTISRALENMPHAMEEYRPDGVYPEGATYWAYGTSYSVLTISLLQSAFGTDFGLANYPGFLPSADCYLLNIAPSGWYYNFADCGDRRGDNGDMALAWFAAHTGNASYVEEERFLRPPAQFKKLSRFSGAGLVWLSQRNPQNTASLPLTFKGEGSNPIAIFRGGEEDEGQFYLGTKGGRGSVNHGNMDAGSFIFELDGVRWVVDPGNQSYHALEKTGFQLWDRCQTCERWTLLTKNNFGHSTLTINDMLHGVDGFASISAYMEGETPSVSFDMSAVFGGDSASQQIIRSFVKESPRSILIEDQISRSDTLRLITWQLMTQAEVSLRPGGATLTQDGKQLELELLSHPDLLPSVISFDPLRSN